MDSNPVILTQIDQAKVEGLALAKSDAPELLSQRRNVCIGRRSAGGGRHSA
jgi:hypothetical protein